MRGVITSQSSESEPSVSGMFDQLGCHDGWCGGLPHGCVGLAFVAPSRHGIYAGGAEADPSSQPALPISKRKLLEGWIPSR